MALSTSDPVDGLTRAQIDSEVELLSAALDTCSSVDIATALEVRRQALLAARTMALVRERAKAREQQAAEARESRESFDLLEKEVRPLLRERAQALDAWVNDGRRLVEGYREVVRRLAAVEAVISPPSGREFHVTGLREQLTLDQPLEQALGRAGVLPGVSVLPVGARCRAHHRVTRQCVRAPTFQRSKRMAAAVAAGRRRRSGHLGGR